jgi:hypothetical protein
MRTNPSSFTTMATTTGVTGSGDPDMALIAELLEDISRNSPAISARKLLVEHYISVGWLEAAMDNVQELKDLVPTDREVTGFLQILQKKPDPPAAEEQPTSISSVPVLDARVWDPKTGRYKTTTTTTGNHARRTPEAPNTKLRGDLEPKRQDLTQGYQTLRAKAKSVLSDLVRLQSLQKKADLPSSKNIVKIQEIAEKGANTPGNMPDPPGSARSIARTIRDNPKEAMSLAITDLEHTMKWIREPHGQPSGATNDAVRDVLVKRSDAVQAALPDNLKIYCELALMHMEHEYLTRNYVNSETMLGDEVKDISRTNFYVTEDNYAWDMDELVQAISANNGVLRNPLSKDMFTPKDIKGILLHPLGQPLAALSVEQREMSKGVRAETIAHMERLATILLEDQTSDTLPSRTAVDGFLAYIATCMFLCHCLTMNSRANLRQCLNSNRRQLSTSNAPPRTAIQDNHMISVSGRLCATQKETGYASTRPAISSNKPPDT